MITFSRNFPSVEWPKLHFSKPCAAREPRISMATYTFCILRRPRDRPLSLVDRALATPDSLLLSQSSREGFESSLSVICDTLRVCFAGQVAKSANKMGVFACIPRDLTHLRTSLHTNMSNTHERWWHRFKRCDILNSLCDPTRRCCVLPLMPLTNARTSKDTESGGGGGGGVHAWKVNTCTKHCCNIHYKTEPMLEKF